MNSEKQYITPTESDLARRIELFHRKEFTDFVSQAGFIHPGQMRLLFEQIEGFETLPKSSAAILLTGQAKATELEGDLVKAKDLFESALASAKQATSTIIDEDVLAFVYYEYGLFYNAVSAPGVAARMFYKSFQLSRTDRLKFLLDYQFWLLDFTEDPNPDFERQVDFISKFQARQMHVMETLGFKWLGITQAGHNHLDEADSNLQKGLALAEKYGLQFIFWDISNSYGLLLRRKVSQEAAIKHFESIIPFVESYKLQVYIRKNLAIRYQVAGRHDEAIDMAMSSLDYAQKHRVYAMIPGLGWLIGKAIREDTGDIQKAFHYYKIGYDEAIKQQEAGLPLTGWRYKMVKEYTEFVTSQLPETFYSMSILNYFEWTKGKSWVEIQDLFHFNFFIYHFTNTGIGEFIFKKLQINPSTFYALTKRMRDLRGINFPDFREKNPKIPQDLIVKSLQDYIRINRDKSWKEINNKFEQDVFAHLFKESGYNKKEMSRNLNLSYASVIRKYKQIALVTPPQ